MVIKKYSLIILLFVLFVGNISGQEVEGGKWSVEFGIVKSYINSTTKFKDTEVAYKSKLNYNWLLPALRFSRNLNFEKSKITLKPFLGFSILGANRGSLNAGVVQIDSMTYFLSTYGTEFQLYYIELGNFVAYSKERFTFQVGLKGQYLLGADKVITEDYFPQRIRLTPTPLPDDQDLYYAGKDLASFGANASLSMQYNWSRFILTIEYWQGITDLSSAQSDWFRNRIYEYNFRFLFGYEF